MMTQTLEAIFENGSFRLLEKPAVPLMEGQHVLLTVESRPEMVDVLALAGQVYTGLSEADVADVEHIALNRRAFFSDR